MFSGLKDKFEKYSPKYHPWSGTHWRGPRSTGMNSEIRSRIVTWTLYYESIGEPDFVMKVVGFHKTADKWGRQFGL